MAWATSRSRAAMSIKHEEAEKLLQEAISAAKRGDWKELIEDLIFCGGERRLSDAMINTMPPKRTYGILHQIAWWGSEETYTALLAKAVVFDMALRTKDGKTAREVAEERNFEDFAAKLADSEAAQRPPEPEPELEPEAAADEILALRRQLCALKPSELLLRARRWGLAKEVLSEAADADDPKAALVDLIVAVESAPE
eukprot:SAG11_NODE_5847_length_1449_cov_1.533333_1_plen_197_part_10